MPLQKEGTRYPEGTHSEWKGHKVHKEPTVTQLYETMYIIRPDLSEETVDQVINQYQTLLRDQGAEDIQTQHRGKRRLAYEIRKFREGIYVQMNYKAAGPLVANLQRAMRLSDEIIRYLTICQDEPDTDVEAATA